MARIAGVDIPREKRLEIALTYIYGLGRTRTAQICEATGINPSTRVRDLTDEEVARSIEAGQVERFRQQRDYEGLEMYVLDKLMGG